MNNEMTPFVPTRDDLISYISDTYKEINGFRPRGVKFSDFSYEQLDQWGRELAAEEKASHKEHARQERIARKLRRIQLKNWEDKKKGYFKPATWTIGDVAGI